MKSATIIVTLVFGLLQYKLWVAPGSIIDIMQLKNAVNVQVNKNQQLAQRNKLLEHEVQDLKYGSQALEERARHELGMVKEDETYYQFIERQA